VVCEFIHAAALEGGNMDKARLDAIRARCEAATPGPWNAIDKGNTVPSYAIRHFAVGEKCVNVASGISTKTGDADFIANARTDVPDLLAEVEKLREQLEHADLVLDAYKQDRDEWRRRAEAAEQDIRDMLYESTLLIDDALCLWCEHYDEPHDLCWAQDCKAECKWRGPQEDKPDATKEASHENE
jgi:hypothetical protein